MPILPPKPPSGPTPPYYATRDTPPSVRLYLGDVLARLRDLPSGSVHCVVTSPPYWGLRDYGTGTWEGGDPTCDHVEKKTTNGISASPLLNPTGERFTSKPPLPFKGACGKCGAIRTDQQLGSEASPEEYVTRMVEVFREVRRVLRDDGTCWLNLGDSYGQNNGKGFDTNQDGGGRKAMYAGQTARSTLPSGNLVGVPWRVALALQADGWILRQDLIWHKPSPMPESVRNRCTKAHEYVFLLAKRSGYYYDAEAIKEEGPGSNPRGDNAAHIKERGDNGRILLGESGPRLSNRRSVWKIASQGYPGAHFATFPPALIEPMIKAGTSERGCCPHCESPWVRVTKEKKLTRERPNAYVKRQPETFEGMSTAPNGAAGVEVSTIGWAPGCSCGIPEEECIGCVVLDPFVGSGTTCAVSLGLGRRSVGIDLSEEYLKKNAIDRIEGVLIDRRLEVLSPVIRKWADLNKIPRLRGTP